MRISVFMFFTVMFMFFFTWILCVSAFTSSCRQPFSCFCQLVFGFSTFFNMFMLSNKSVVHLVSGFVFPVHCVS